MKLYNPHSLGLDVVSISSHEAICICPFHNDNSPSSTFNIKSGLFHCFGCGSSFNVYQLAQELNSTIQTDFDLKEVRRDRKNGVYSNWRWILNSPLALDNPYLESRGIKEETVKHFDIRDCKVGVGVIIRDIQGKVTGSQIRMYDGMNKYLTFGSKTPFWPIENIQAKEDVLIVEGIFGVFNAFQHGFNAVAVMGASSVVSAAPYVKALPHDSLICFDNDYAGYLNACKLCYLSGKSMVVPAIEADEVDLTQAFQKKVGVTNNVGVVKEFLAPSERNRFVSQFTSFIQDVNRGRYDGY